MISSFFLSIHVSMAGVLYTMVSWYKRHVLLTLPFEMSTAAAPPPPLPPTPPGPSPSPPPADFDDDGI